MNLFVKNAKGVTLPNLDFMYVRTVNHNLRYGILIKR